VGSLVRDLVVVVCVDREPFSVLLLPFVALRGAGWGVNKSLYCRAEMFAAPTFQAGSSSDNEVNSTVSADLKAAAQTRPRWADMFDSDSDIEEAV
jgi:hypothetical protein